MPSESPSLAELPPIPANLMQEPQTEQRVRDELFKPLPNATPK